MKFQKELAVYDGNDKFAKPEIDWDDLSEKNHLLRWFEAAFGQLYWTYDDETRESVSTRNRELLQLSAITEVIDFVRFEVANEWTRNALRGIALILTGAIQRVLENCIIVSDAKISAALKVTQLCNLPAGRVSIIFLIIIVYDI